jgi:3-phosphoshikimate 1-carboxyvinyltransferase
MSRAIISPAQAPLEGTLHLPGDKSLSHRRALFSLFVHDEVRLTNYGTGDDCQTTLNCLQSLGKSVARNETEVLISGPAGCLSAELDCGNSGTTARLLMGILAGHEGGWTLTGDTSLSARPMERVAVPLRMMGAQIELIDGHLPAHVVGRPLTGIDFESPVASAQVKSAVLLAGLKARGVTRYREPIITRDHTERLLGVGIDYVEWITVNPEHVRLSAEKLSGALPADPSSAAFWIVAALMVPGSHITLPHLLANPHRMALVKLLWEHGAKIRVANLILENGEDEATVEVHASPVSPLIVRQPVTAKLIDELPVLVVLATRLAGRSSFYDAGELRVKESDRLRLTVENLRQMGAEVEDWRDGFAVTGPCELRGAEIHTERDHRIAMAFAVAGLSAKGKTVVHDAECVSVSYPNFWDDLAKLAPSSVRLA